MINYLGRISLMSLSEEVEDKDTLAPLPQLLEMTKAKSTGMLLNIIISGLRSLGIPIRQLILHLTLLY